MMGDTENISNWCLGNRYTHQLQWCFIAGFSWDVIIYRRYFLW